MKREIGDYLQVFNRLNYNTEDTEIFIKISWLYDLCVLNILSLRQNGR